MGVIERRQRQKENIRTGILQAARNIATKENWQAVTIRKIADEIEYTAPIVYEYFENKEAVLLAIALEGAEILLEKISNVALTEDPKARLIQFAQAHWQFACEHPEVYKLMFGFEWLPSHPEARPKIALQVRKIFLDTLSEISGVTDETKLESFSFNYMCILHGFTSLIMLAQSRKKEIPQFDPPHLLGIYMERFIKSIS
ncbi:TetR/AcrR family transcriptional regulator [Rhodocytophaga rosea]|uniref:TetR/AcrR family transcriptional regulator n=1 Tax=Rhodocytophaga rosea TaxID=2704465 RepID=A0A6C0GV90_9BACT|nr:TetR/AcrR family transcriptional regulator [Rhodocytophaga rosea]QHT71270.1 TetR/AcrR family transcriptional regulator [Rhodocytophaga rosea]